MHTSRVVSCGVLALAMTAFPASRAAGEVARLVLDSEPGDYIGQGQMWDVLFDVDLGATLSAQVFENGDGEPETVQFVMDDNGPINTFTLLAFSSRDIGPLAVGEYLDAQRYPFQDPGHPGLSCSFQNRGCNTLTGSFVILAIDFDAGNDLVRLSASFEQHCEGGDPALFGQFQYTRCSRADLDFSGDVGILDLLRVLAAWGGSGPEDLDGSGSVDIGDLVRLLGEWGGCV